MGVNKTSKGHLLQANWALIASHLMVFRKSTCENSGQKKDFSHLSDKVYLLHLEL